MKNVFFVLMSLVFFVSCKSGIEYRDTEVTVKYDVISGTDTLHLDTKTVINEASYYKPTVFVIDDGQTLIIRGVSSKNGHTSEHGWEVDSHGRRHFSKYNYPKCKVVIKDVEMKCIRVYETSHWSGEEITND